MDFNDICWLWIKSEIKEFQEIIQNWINHNGEQIREYFSKKIGHSYLTKEALYFIQKGKGKIVQAYLKQTILKFLESSSENFASKLKLIHRCLGLRIDKELSHNDQEIVCIAEKWLTEKTVSVQEWVKKKRKVIFIH